MQAFEFYATPENGVIRIPEIYKDKITAGVKVIVLKKNPWTFNRDEPGARHKSDLLLAPTMSTKGWRFDREEANER